MRRLKNNRRQRLVTLGIVMLSTVTGLCAQDNGALRVMSLGDCIDYAMKHNTTIEQRQLAVENSELTLENSRYSRLPDLNAGVGQGWGFGRSTSRDGSTVDRTSAQTSFQVSSSMQLFTGFRIPNQVKADKFSLMAATENLEKARRDLGVQIASYYLNALYYKGLAKVQRHQLELDEEALRKAEALYEAGRKPKSEVAAAEAQVAVSQHSLVEAVGNETMARLDLMQALNMVDVNVEQFAVCDIDTEGIEGEMTSADLVIAEALEHHPTILAAKYNLESSRHSLKVAQSARYPTLSLSASYSNSYYYTYDMENMDLSKQLDLNGSEYIGLSLNIPIFNRFQTRNNVRQARLQVMNQELSLTDARLQLQKEIQQAYWNAVKARENYRSAQKASASTQLSYQYEMERFAAGNSTAYELQQARTRMEKSETDEVQARYEYLMRVRILEFYK